MPVVGFTDPKKCACALAMSKFFEMSVVKIRVRTTSWIEDPASSKTRAIRSMML